MAENESSAPPHHSTATAGRTAAGKSGKPGAHVEYVVSSERPVCVFHSVWKLAGTFLGVADQET